MNKKVFGTLIFALFIFGINKGSLAQVLAGSNCHSAKAGGKNASENSVNVTNKICPVSGTKLSEVTKSGMKPVKHEYKSKIYNLCCAGCTTSFNNDPKKYVKKAEDELRIEKEINAEHE